MKGLLAVYGETLVFITTAIAEVESGSTCHETCLAPMLPQAAQTRRVKNFKDLYGNLDNKLKKIFTRKSSKQKAVLYCRGDFVAFCVVTCLIECDLRDFSNSRVVTRTQIKERLESNLYNLGQKGSRIFKTGVIYFAHYVLNIAHY